jgi:hypothetical protein
VAFVRNLLKDDIAESFMSTLKITVLDLQTIFLFVKDGMDLDCLNGCRVLCLGNGKLCKIQKSQADIYYIVDIKGYNLFKDIVAAELVRPTFLNLDMSTQWALPRLNLQRIGAAPIDMFVQKKLESRFIHTYSPEDSEWIKRVSAYVSSKGYDVNFYDKLPTLPVSNPDTFVSF